MRSLTLSSQLTRNRANQLVALCDISGSMGSIIDPPSWKKIDTLRQLIAELETMPVWLFSDEAWRFDRDEPEALERLMPMGGTNLAGALRRLKAEGYRRVLVLTDGQPDSESAALAEAYDFEEITARYIGPPPAPTFLARLTERAANTRGCEAIDFGRGKAKALAGQFRQLAHRPG